MENLSGQCYSEDCWTDGIIKDGGEDAKGAKNKGMDKTNSTRSTNGNAANNSRRNKTRWDQPETTHSTGSLLSSMERFVQTVDDMNETILIPCRLMDLQFDETFLTNSAAANSAGPAPMATSTATPTNHSHMTSTGDNNRVLSNLGGVDLYQFYSVLNNIKNDLMWGKRQSSTTIPATNGLSLSPSSASVISSVSSSMIMTSSSSSSSSSSSASSNASLSQVVVGAQNGVGGQPGQPGQGHVKGHVRRPSTVSTTSSTSASDTEFSELNEDSGVEAEHEEDCAQAVADAFHHHLNGLQQCLCDLTLAADYVTNRYTNALGGF